MNNGDKRFTARFREWMERYRTPVYRDIFIYLAVLLACGFYRLEYQKIEKYMPLMRAGLACLFGLMAVWLGFCNGFWRRLAFPVSATLAAMLPAVLYLATNGREFDHGFGGFCAELAVLLFCWPYEMMRKMIGRVMFSLPLGVVAFLPVVAVWIFFFLGATVRIRFFQQGKS